MVYDVQLNNINPKIIQIYICKNIEQFVSHKSHVEYSYYRLYNI